MNDIRMTGEYQRKVSDLVNREVLTGINELMQALQQSEDIIQGDYSEELINIRGSENYEEPALYEIENADDSQLAEYIEYAEVETKQELLTFIDDSEPQDFCNHFEIEPHQIETYEFWVVSDYFGRKLSERGENVQEILGLTVWGRTTTGQAISMDSVICDIYDDINS